LASIMASQPLHDAAADSASGSAHGMRNAASFPPGSHVRGNFTTLKISISSARSPSSSLALAVFERGPVLCRELDIMRGVDADEVVLLRPDLAREARRDAGPELIGEDALAG
jgi:hypothetical protein